MEKFAKKHGLLPNQVKIRIMNSRRAFKKNRSKMAEEMGISV